jgi:3-isopropylmalate dehydrogenase
MKKIITVLAGDGIGQEVMPQAIKVLNTIAKKFNHSFVMKEADIGGSAYEKHGTHFPEATKRLVQNADAVLFGSVGGPVYEAHLPKWKNCERNSILALRKTLELCSNLRPAQIYPELQAHCPLKDHLIQQGINILIVRELVGDIYFGEHKQWQHEGKRYASDVAEYNEEQIAAVAHQGFQLARGRSKKLTSVDKANVLDTSKLWREIVTEIAIKYSDVTLEHMLVDNCAMQLILNPAQFDVILTANLFGDILSDAAAALPGSLGLMPSASLNATKFGLYEPSGGSAPDIAGKNIANPIAQILSVAMMLRYSFDLFAEAILIEDAVRKALKQGFRTQDIHVEGTQLLGTEEMTHVIINYIK